MRSAFAVAPLLLCASLCLAAPAPSDRITEIDSRQTAVLHGSVPTAASAQSDLGPVDPAMQLGYITLMTQPSPSQQADLDQFLAQLEDRSSPNYHKWLTPEQFAARYGLSQADIDKITAWLRGEGFNIVQVARGRDWIAFSGTAGQAESAFHTQIHYYNVDGETHFANATEFSVPQALSGIASGLRGMTDFGWKPLGIREVGVELFSPVLAQPDYNLGGSHFLAPSDLATIYNLAALYNSGLDGTGMKLAVLGQVDITKVPSGSVSALTDIRKFRSVFGLAANDPVQTIAGGAPGTSSSDIIETDLDLEWAGAVAPDATIEFVTAENGGGFSGVFTAEQTAIDNVIAPVISLSYGACESDNASFLPSNEFEMKKANTEGITFISSSGDSGAAGCDSDQNNPKASKGLAVNYPASSPEATAVGGNTFNEGGGNYWSNSNGANLGSALSYIPEVAWNDTLLNNSLAASGGGKSSCESPGCASGFPKPAWQIGSGVPNDGVRDVPDVAMAASADHDGYLICNANSCASGIGNRPVIVGGTSASAPVFAGIITILNQKVGGTGLGNINGELYTLAQGANNVIFHDVTSGSNIVPCVSGSTGCPASGQYGYTAGAGYDQVTGLGSVDADELVNHWNLSSTTTALTSSETAASFGTAVKLTATVAASSATGTVTFNEDSAQLGTGTLASGTTTFTWNTASGDVGAHSMTAVYGGDSNDATSTSAAITETITNTSGTATTTVLLSSQNPATYGGPLTFTATVTGTSPTKTVTFQDGVTPLGFQTLSAGVAQFTPATPLAAGVHSITGLYSGDATNQTSTSIALSQTINAASTTTTLSLSPSSPANHGTTVAFTATVSSAFANPPDGETVTFSDATAGTLGTGKLSQGKAVFTSAALPAASYNVVASYAADGNFSKSSSSAVPFSVQDFSLGTPAAVSVSTPGGTGTTTITVTPLGGFSQAVTLSCPTSGLPAETTCAISPGSVTPNGKAVSATLTITTTAASSRLDRRLDRRNGLFYALWMPGLAGLLLCSGVARRRGQWAHLLALALILSLSVLWMVGCGGGNSSGGGTTNAGTPTGKTSFTVTATAGTLSHPVSVTLNVQ